MKSGQKYSRKERKMKNRIKWFVYAVIMLPALIGIWVFIGALFVAVPFLALLKPSLFDKEK